MTKRTIEIEVFTIESHPEPELCLDWIRNNWHDLGNHVLQEAVVSLKAFASYFGASVDYSIGIFPGRGEYIRFDRVNNGAKIGEYMDLDLSGNCPFTDVYYDEILLDAVRDAKPSADLLEVLDDAADRLMTALHNEGEYIYSDDGLRDMCEANEYEFNADGSLF